MATSGADVKFEYADMDELLTLADLAGIKAPGNTLKAVIELVSMGVPPPKVHELLREILACKSRAKRVSGKSSSRRAQPSSKVTQNQAAPESLL